MKHSRAAQQMFGQETSAAAYRVLQGLEEQLVCKQVHRQLLIPEGVDAVGCSTRSCPDLQERSYALEISVI